MALATRPRPKAYTRKRQAGHHHHGKLYLKAYWPYLPMLAIVSAGALANQALYKSSLLSPKAGAVIGASHYSASLGTTSRLQNLIGNQAPWILLAALGITAAAFIIFIVTHWYRLHRLITKGEAFIIRRPAFEISTVAVFTFGFVLTRW